MDEVNAREDVRKAPVALVTDTGGDAAGEVGKLRGRLAAMVLVVPEADFLDPAGTVTVTKVETGEVVAEGTVAEFMPDGSLNAPATVLSDESLAVVVEDGGNTKSGTLYVYWS